MLRSVGYWKMSEALRVSRSGCDCDKHAPLSACERIRDEHGVCYCDAGLERINNQHNGRPFLYDN